MRCSTVPREAFRFCSSAFSFDTVGAKRKSLAKRKCQRTFHALRSVPRALPLTRKLLKKFDQNFAIYNQTCKKGVTMLPELLAPVGNPQTLDAAIEGGADAVYLGGTLFNARMNARNFDRPALADAVEKCHARGVRLYVTLNTQILDRQMQDALNYVVFL